MYKLLLPALALAAMTSVTLADTVNPAGITASVPADVHVLAGLQIDQDRVLSDTKLQEIRGTGGLVNVKIGNVCAPISVNAFLAGQFTKC